MKLAVVGTGYVGLVTGVTLAAIGHDVTCIDADEAKVMRMRRGISPIYEPGLPELMQEMMTAGRLTFTTCLAEGIRGASVIYIAVGTPERHDGSADLRAVEAVARDIARAATTDAIVVTKSTVPVGTNDRLQQLLQTQKLTLEVASNPEFLREGSAITDSFYGDRIVLGTQSEHAASVLEQVNQPFGIPLFKTDVRSAEMIKYASNAFLATKISFMNEIANICERVDVDVEQVARGMGLDQRIGPAFLRAGIGYGGSCFPKDTKALMQIAGNVAYDFELLQGVINVNNKQQQKLVQLVCERLGEVRGKKIAILGVAFKPNTDDVREAPSIPIINALLGAGATVIVYDPVALENAKKIWGASIQYAEILEHALIDAEAALIVTEWDEIKQMDMTLFDTMRVPLIFDGRNCFSLRDMEQRAYEYYSIGRKAVKPKQLTEGW